jgi:hypothetical protein
MVTTKSCICGKDVGDKECFQKCGREASWKTAILTAEKNGGGGGP